MFWTLHIGLFSVFHFLVLGHGKYFRWISCFLPLNEHFLALKFISGLHDTFCYWRMRVVNNSEHLFLVYYVLINIGIYYYSQIKSKCQWSQFFFFFFVVNSATNPKKTQAGAERPKTCRVTNENGNCEACTTWECCQLLTKGFTARL